MSLNYKKILFIVIIFLFTLFISVKIVDMILYDYMFVVNMTEENYKITNSYENGIEFSLQKDGEYYYAYIPEQITGNSLNLKIKLDEENKRINEVICNDIKIEDKNIIKLTDYSKYDSSYENMPLFIINRNSTIKICISIALALVTTIIILAICLKEKKNNNNLLERFTYSSSFFRILNKKDIIILAIIFLLISFITVGCDAIVIANVGNLFAENIDIYQLQVNSKFITGRVYAEFPYNPLMLCIWGGIMTLFRPITKALPIIGNFPYFEVAILKFFSLIFIFLTISSVLSFLLDRKIIKEKDAKWIYYLSLFNPVTFYVALLFVQLDALTLYLITTGALLLMNINKDGFLGILLLSIGLLLKMQILFLIPITIIMILYIIFYYKDKLCNKIIRTIKCALIFLWIAITCLGIQYLLKTPFYYLQSNLEQSERLWYTVIPYTNYTYLYVTLGALAIAMIIFLLNIHSRIKKENIIMSSIIYYAVIIFLFSFSILPTPSIYIATLGGIVIVLALEKDRLKNIIFIIMSSLIIICPMFSDYGDISKIIRGPNESGIITNYIKKMEEKDSKKINSITFTISAVSMLTYAVYMGKKSIKVLSEKESKENE